jgi:hypothetical protein
MGLLELHHADHDGAIEDLLAQNLSSARAAEA